jgi:hypothetical protein
MAAGEEAMTTKPRPEWMPATPRTPKEAAFMVHECGFDYQPFSPDELIEKARARGYIILPEFAEKVAGWHRDAAKKHADRASAMLFRRLGG